MSRTDRNDYDYRQIPDAEEIARRSIVVEKILRRRAKLAPLEMSAADLVRRARKMEAEPTDG